MISLVVFVCPLQMDCNLENRVICDSSELVASSVAGCISTRYSLCVACSSPSSHCIVNPLCLGLNGLLLGETYSKTKTPLKRT